MFGKLFRFSRDQGPDTRPALPEGQRVYAIGDVHGRHDLLEDLLARLSRDSAARAASSQTLIFLGDYIDRGPHSAQVIELLLGISQVDPTARFLLGNHEEVFLRAMSGDIEALKFFTRIGGRETILSYGITPEEFDFGGYEDLYELLRARVPEAHIAFLKRGEDMIELGDYVFVHAGIRPGIPLPQQKTSDLRWIREEFLETNMAIEKVVVHGHTISQDAAFRRHRIGIDTGAWRGGKLTALGLEGTERWLVQSGSDAPGTSAA